MRAPDDEMEAAPPARNHADGPDRPEAADAPADAAADVAADVAGPALHRQVDRYRPWYRRERRAAAGLVAISLGTIGASAGLFAWTASPGSRPVRVVVSTEPSNSIPDMDDLPAEIPEAAPETPTALLAADDAIGEPVDRVAADGAPAARGVAAAADGYGVIAVWTDRVVWVSRDDGRSFRQELAAPGPVSAVAVGRGGRVYAARHGRVGMLSPGGHTRWLDLDAGQVLAIAAAQPAPRAIDPTSPPEAGWLAVLALHDDEAAGVAPLLWLSDDDGISWKHLVAPHHGDASNRMWVSPDGVIDLLTEDTDGSASGDEGSDDLFGAGEWRLRHYRARAMHDPLTLLFAGDSPVPLAMGHDGLRWRLARAGGRMQLAAADNAPTASGRVAGPAAGRPAGGTVPVRNWDVRLAAGGQQTLAVADGRLLELGRGGPRLLTRRVPGRIDALATDGIGRAVATAGGSALRYSRRHGWRRLFEIPPR